MKRLLSSLLFFIGFLIGVCQDYPGTMISVVDGDTFVFQAEEGNLKVRMSGIDAPEKEQAYGEDAKEYLEGFLYQDAILTTQGVDRYGRTLGTLYIQDLDINAKMISSGYAWHYMQYSDNLAYAVYENGAREQKRGLWQDPEPLAPWDYRHAGQSNDLNLIQAGTADSVLICNSSGAYAYHSHNCQGLKRCKHTIIKVSLQKAKAMGRKPCGYCY